jgi:hypothetical protein
LSWGWRHRRGHNVCGLHGRSRYGKRRPHSGLRYHKFRRGRRGRCGRRHRSCNPGGGRSRHRRLGFYGSSGRDRSSRRWRSCGRLLFTDDGFQNVAGLRNLGKINLGFNPVNFRAAGTGRLGGTLGFAGAPETSPDFLGLVLLDGTGMGLLLGDADFGQGIENDLAFDFQLSGQVVDSNLTHPPFLGPAPLPKSSSHPHGVSVAHRPAALATSAENPDHSFGSAVVSSSLPSVCAAVSSAAPGSVSSAAAATS